MNVVKLKEKNIDIVPPPQSRVPIDTNDVMFTHHVNLLALGKRGSGKSVYITNYLRMLKEQGKLDRLLVISPTAGSNKALLEMLGVNEEDVLDPEDKEVVSKVLEIIDGERDDWVKYLDDLERWKEFQKLLNDDRVPINAIDPYLMLEFTDQFGQPQKPKSTYGHRPFIHLFVDDCQSSPLFRNRRWLNLVIRHRHLGEMPYVKGHPEKCGAIGVSLYTALQNLKSTSGGCPRAIRNNATQMVIVGKSKDQKELKDIYESIGGEVEYPQFIQAYDYATDKPYGSLTVDLHPKKQHLSRFRSGLNEWIIFE